MSSYALKTTVAATVLSLLLFVLYLNTYWVDDDMAQVTGPPDGPGKVQQRMVS